MIHSLLFSALIYHLENGCKWRALPKRFEKWHTIYVRLDRWSRKRVLEVSVLGSVKGVKLVKIVPAPRQNAVLGKFAKTNQFAAVRGGMIFTRISEVSVECGLFGNTGVSVIFFHNVVVDEKRHQAIVCNVNRELLYGVNRSLL